MIELNNIKKENIYLKCKDYTVSNEEYKLIYNEKLDTLHTHPIPNDISKYYESDNYISHTDSNKSIIDKVYKLVRNYTLKKKLKLINSYKTNNKEILDIGCGTGDFLKICKENGWNTSGVEPSEKAREKTDQKGILVYKQIDSYTDKKFDVITLWHVLEHVTNLNDYIKELKKLLKKNGILIIAVPNYKSYDAQYYKEFWAAYDVPRHIYHFSKKSIEIIFKEINMEIDKILPMLFDSYYVALLSEKYKHKKNRIINAFFIGLKSNIKAKKTKQYSSHIYILKNS